MAESLDVAFIDQQGVITVVKEVWVTANDIACLLEMGFYFPRPDDLHRFLASHSTQSKEDVWILNEPLDHFKDHIVSFDGQQVIVMPKGHLFSP